MRRRFDWQAMLVMLVVYIVFRVVLAAVGVGGFLSFGIALVAAWIVGPKVVAWWRNR